MPTISAVEEVVASNGFPVGFARALVERSKEVKVSYVIVDNSRSMLKRDGHRLVVADGGVPHFEECTRWEEVTSSMNVMVSHADKVGAPMEVRLLNKAQPVTVGEGADPAKLAAVRALLATEPSGLTPVCRQILEVIDRIRAMESELVASGKVALLLIITDGESTDGKSPLRRRSHPPHPRVLFTSCSTPAPSLSSPLVRERGGDLEAVGGLAAQAHHPHVHGRARGV